jgi:hypothetical protein
MQVNIDLGPKLFSFDSFNSWVNHASTAWKRAGVRSDDTLCIDQSGRVVRIGGHFMKARDESAFPVDVYLMRTDLQQNAEVKGDNT